MSAYVVEFDLIDAILSYATGHNGCLRNRGMDVDDIGQMLLDQNYRSVNFRYNESETAPKYVFRHYTRAMSPVQIIKACNCYDYQACETDDYGQTEAAELVRKIRNDAICNLPGYDDAEWGMPCNPRRQHAA